MTIGLFAPPRHSQSRRLYQLLEERAPGKCQFLPFPEHGEPTVCLDENGVFWGAVNAAEFDIAMVFGYRYMSPVVPPVVDETDWSVWQTGHIAAQQEFSFFTSAFTELQRRGVRVYNAPAAHIAGFARFDILSGLGDKGFSVPRLVCTNDDKKAGQVLEAWGEGKVLWRPCAGRAAWQHFLAPQREFLMSATKAPVMLAEIVDGPLVRAYVLNGKPVIYLGRNAPAMAPLETLEVVQEVRCPEVDDELQRLATTLGMGWVQISFALHDGRPWIYDIDTDPILDWMPTSYSDLVLSRLASALLDEPSNDVDAGTLVPAARPMLFLRRMLTILFQLEQAKYQRR